MVRNVSQHVLLYLGGKVENKKKKENKIIITGNSWLRSLRAFHPDPGLLGKLSVFF